jgi:uncharacterized protein (DUF433 family)
LSLVSARHCWRFDPMSTQLYPHIVADSDVLSGRPVVEGTQVPVSTLIEQVARGKSLDEVARECGVSVEDVRSALEYGAQRAGEPAVAATPENKTSGGIFYAASDSQAVEEEARRVGLDPTKLFPLGRCLLELRVQGIASGERLFSSWDEVDAEIAERRGSRYPDDE